MTIWHNRFGLSIEIVAIAIDVRDHSRVAPITSLIHVNPGMEFEEFCRLLLSAVREREIHETHEWFQVDGEHLVNPHLAPLTLSKQSSSALQLQTNQANRAVHEGSRL